MQCLISDTNVTAIIRPCIYSVAEQLTLLMGSWGTAAQIGYLVGYSLILKRDTTKNERLARQTVID
jgi:hypothetical protein